MNQKIISRVNIRFCRLTRSYLHIFQQKIVSRPNRNKEPERIEYLMANGFNRQHIFVESFYERSPINVNNYNDVQRSQRTYKNLHKM